jgi:hypothetical protein
MADKTGFYVDSRDFDKHFSRVVANTIPKLTNKGLVNAAGEALRDADLKEPYLPVDEKNLRGSKEIHGSKDLFELFVEFGFNMIYAAYLHEKGKVGWNWTRPGSGPKFLSTKLVRYKDKYIKIVAVTIKKGQSIFPDK